MNKTSTQELSVKSDDISVLSATPVETEMNNIQFDTSILNYRKPICLNTTQEKLTSEEIIDIDNFKIHPVLDKLQTFETNVNPVIQTEVEVHRSNSEDLTVVENETSNTSHSSEQDLPLLMCVTYLGLDPTGYD